MIEVVAEQFEVVHRSLFKKCGWNLASEFMRVNETMAALAAISNERRGN
jgi:hypothetical protein